MTTRFRSLLTACAVLVSASAAAQNTVLCFGDSITFGAAGRTTDAYLGPLGGYLPTILGPVVLENRGKGGELTDAGRTRLTTLLAQKTYTHVLIMEGANDINGWVVNPPLITQSQTGTNLQKMVQAAKGSGATVVIATIPPRKGGSVDASNSLTSQLNTTIRNIAAAEGALLADVYGNLRHFIVPAAYSDTIHPSSLGDALVAESFAAALSGTSVDLAPPIPIATEPSAGTNSAAIDTDVAITVRDRVRGTDLATGAFAINGVAVIASAIPFGSDSEFRYVFPSPLRFGESVGVSFRVADLNTPPNWLSWGFSFHTAAGNGSNGDIDRSGRIDGADLAILAASFGTVKGEGRYRKDADIDADGSIDGVDLMLVVARFGGTP